ncbi:MAG: flavin reductase family protein [Lachnospiraceae bacterium]
MAKQVWKPGNMLYPLPVVLVGCRGKDGQDNLITVAWAGTICTNPPMLSISVRPERYSHKLIKESMEFTINLTTKELTYATDYCGVVSGKEIDKWSKLNLHKIEGQHVCAPLLAESPVNIECKVEKIEALGSHDMFIAKVVAVHADEKYMDESGKFHLEASDPIVYSHGNYFTIGENQGSFGYSIKKK